MNKEKEKLSGFQRIARVMAHDLKNAIANIDLSLQQLEEEATRKEQQGYFDIIKRNNEKINQTLDHLLNATIFELLNKEACYIHKIIDQILIDAEDRIRNKNITVFKTYENIDSQIIIDPKKLRIALSHILTNAFEAMKGNKNKLIIATKNVDSHSVITISDNGIGMDNEAKFRAFDPYFTTKREKGSGLGLTMAQKIILNHNGNIMMKSTPKSGTSMTIRLPLS